MKQLLATILMLSSLALAGSPGAVFGEKQQDRFLSDLLSAAPWLQHRISLYQHRLDVENPPEHIKQELFKSCIGPLAKMERGLLHALAADPAIASSTMMPGEYDPFVQVSKTDSLCSQVNFAINSVSSRILMVWQDERSGFDNPDIYAQVFDLTYAPIGTNIKINPEGLKAAQIAPDVCALSDGRFLVCWEDYSTSTPQIIAQLVKQDGVLQGVPVMVSAAATTPQFFPQAAAYGDSVHVTWLQKDGQDYNIYIRTLSLMAVLKAPAVRVNDDGESLQWAPGIASFGDGQTAVVWEDKRDGDSEIYAQVYKADGVKRGDNFKVNSDPLKSLQWRPAAAGNASALEVVWEDYQNRAAAIYTQQFDRYALPAGENLRLDQLEVRASKENPHVNFEEQGRRVFAWQEKSADAWRLKFVVFAAFSNVPVYYGIGEADALHEFTNVKLDQIRDTVYFTFLGQKIGGKSTVLCHKATYSTVAVELAHFQSAAQNDRVTLIWRTASETNNLGFEIERMYAGENYARIGFVEGKGTTSAAQQYSFVDKGLAPGKYYYRLRQVNLDGTSTLSEEVTAVIEGPEQFELLTAHPNPFQAETNLTMRLPETAQVRVLAYNLLGQRVRMIAEGIYAPGQHAMRWDGCDDAGLQLPAGEYVLRVQMGERAETRRVAIVR